MKINEDKRNSVLMDLTVVKILIDKAINETKDSDFYHYRYNEYLEVARQIITDIYINWDNHDKI